MSGPKVAIRASVVEGEGQFLIVSCPDEGFRTYSGRVGERVIDAVLKPGVETVVDDDFMKVPAFVKDFQGGVITLRRSDVVPEASRPDLDSRFELSGNQREMAHRICYSETMPPEVEQMIYLHRLLRDGATANGIAVTKRWAVNEHIHFLKATLDLETRYKNRKSVKAMLSTAITEVEAL